MRKLILFVLIGAVLTIESYSQACSRVPIRARADGQCSTGEWKLVFEENFNGNKINKDKWKTMLGYGCRCNNNEDPQAFMNENVSVKNGELILTFKKSAKPVKCKCSSKQYTKQYTSGIIWSHQKVLYGKIEGRIKIANGTGLYPAFWTWSSKGEIDIFEFKESESSPFFTVHNTAGSKRHMCPEWYSGIDYSQEYHIYTMIWDPFFIEFYIDDNLVRKVWRYTTPLGQPVDCSEFIAGRKYRELASFPPDDSPQSIIVSFGGQKNRAEYTSPAELKVDWIRAWQYEDNTEDPMPGLRIDF